MSLYLPQCTINILCINIHFTLRFGLNSINSYLRLKIRFVWALNEYYLKHHTKSKSISISEIFKPSVENRGFDYKMTLWNVWACCEFTKKYLYVVEILVLNVGIQKLFYEYWKYLQSWRFQQSSNQHEFQLQYHW